MATSKHLFWVENYKKWIPAKELTVGMELKDANNNINSILSIEVINNVDVPTYNFEVEDIHNYFVGQLGLLVHNQNKPSLFESTTKNNVEFYQVRNNSTGKLEYIGQTKQGIDVRKGQHIAEGTKKGNFKADWADDAKYTFEPVDIPKKDLLTPYEAHTWEKHLIDKAKADGNPLKNKANPIGEAKYNKFKGLHNPC